MPSQKCNKCHAELDESVESCSSCKEKSAKFRTFMTWFCIILLFVAGMFWAFTDSEPDVSINSAPGIEAE